MDGSLCGKRVLIIEDEYFIAMDIKRVLQHAGAEVLGPLGNVAQALAMVADEQVDAAVLDINLNGVMSYPVAQRLNAMGVPYLFLTGYDSWSLPKEFRAKPHVVKPFSPEQLVAAVQGLGGAPAHGPA